MRLGSIKRFGIVLLLFLLLMSLGFITYKLFFDKDAKDDIFEGDVFPEPVMDPNEDFHFQDADAIYKNDIDGSVVDVYVTVLPPDSNKYSVYSELLAYKFDYNTRVKKPIAKAFFQLGDENGPKSDFLQGFDETANAVIMPRGHSSSRSPHKSYKIKLIDKESLWGAQTTLNLNYHPGDKTRVRNKLSYDLYEGLDNIPSCRTQFVRLHIKDLSEGDKKSSDVPFKSLGLFTHVEQLNRRYLTSHGLDSDGNLYKAHGFAFYRYPEVLKLATDPSYNEEKFEERLAIHGSKDHKNLLAMLDALNDVSMDIDDVIDKYFDRDNYLTWMASNIIIGNQDTVGQNFLIYSPKSSDKFYFIPWDCDGAWGWVFADMTEEQLNNFENIRYADWQFGIQNLWATKLNNRFLRKNKNVEALDKKLDELMQYYSPERIREQLKKYYPAVSNDLSKYKTLENLSMSTAEFAHIYNMLPNIPQINYDIYINSKARPMPFYQNPAEVKDGKVLLSWGQSYDLQNDPIHYELTVAKTPDMMNPIISKTGLTENSFVVELPFGHYYMKVVAVDSNGNRMNAFDKVVDENRIKHFGVRAIDVK